MSKIRVLEVIRQGDIGGGESHLIDLVNGFESNIEPVVLSFSSGQMIENLSINNITCHVIKTKLPFNLLIKKEKIDIIHAHGTRAASNMLFASSITKLPLIYTVHGWSFHQDQIYLKRKD